MGKQEGITIHLSSKEDLAIIIKSLNRTKMSYGVVNTSHEAIIDSLVEQLVQIPVPDTTEQ